MPEVVPLFRLRWRQVQESLIYWVRIGLEYDASKRTTAERLYGLYLVVVLTVLVLFPGWVEVLAVAAGAGHVLPPQLRAAILAVVPALVALGQIVLLMSALRSSPYKLSDADTAYVAGAPVQRGAPILLDFLFRVAVRGPAIALLAALIAVALTQPAAAGTATRLCLAVAAATLPLGVFSWGLAWSIGLLRLASPTAQRRRFVWLAPLAVLMPLALLPAVVTWPGWTLSVTMRAGGHVAVQTVGVVGLALLTVGAVLWIGNRASMTLIAAESALYARLHSLGLTARLIDPALVRQIRRQERLRAKRFLLHLPRASGSRALVARAALGALRHPFVLIWPLVWGLALTRLGATLLLDHAGGLVWVYWLVAVVLTAPRGLPLPAFREDVAEPFLRQFVPARALVVLLADAALPWTLLATGTLLGWVGQPATPGLIVGSMALSVVLAGVLVLCQGAALIPLSRWRLRVSAAATTATSVASVVGLGLFTRTLMAPLGLAVAIAALLGGMLADSA